jgi:hypothetical protein
MDSTLDTAAFATVPDRDRWMAWGGVAFLLLFIAMMALGGDDIAEKSTGKQVVDAMNDGSDAVYISIFLAAPAVACLLAFTARLRDVTGGLGGAARHLLQYGAVLLSGAIAFDAVLTLGLVSSADHDQEGVAQTINVLSADDWIPFTIGAAMLLIGAGLSVLRSGALPTWMGWIALVVGVVSLLGPGGFAGFFIGPLWIGVAGVMLATRRPVVVV